MLSSQQQQVYKVGCDNVSAESAEQLEPTFAPVKTTSAKGILNGTVQLFNTYYRKTPSECEMTCIVPTALNILYMYSTLEPL